MTKKGFRLPFGRQDEGTADEVGALREENHQLRRAVEELSILNDLARAIGASVDSEDIIHKIVDRSMRAVQAEQTVVTLVDRDARQSMKTLVRAMTSSADHPHFHINENLIGWMHLYKKPLCTNDPTSDDRFRGLKWDASINSILCVPLMVKSELIGVVTSYNKKTQDGFTEEDQRLLAIIAGQSAQIIENARLYEEEKALAGMKEQIKLAAQIQQDLLPKNPPQLPGYELAASSDAAQMVGGDYFDFIHVPHDRWAVCLGDVSGKGLPASLLMANLQATLRGQTALDSPVGETISRSNRLIYESTDPEKFATLFIALLDSATHDLSYCNAGHENPILLRADGSVDRLPTGGMALGVLEDFPYEAGEARMEAGDIMVIYSDGIPDAVNEFEHPFGEERLIACLRESAAEPAGEILRRVVAAVREHEQGAERIDDLTIIVVKRTQ
ncbi:MAG: SpoIIE family protein phosphatase [Candidatus Krumholzibacteria bacterium]|nr:SpoIIE family protein phosphatase [Candidatus Krumholzibacteria bacterium]MDH5269545.1 SpoIIE family protein phosphatase [Candidatus Krumholzibacteria bacterium]